MYFCESVKNGRGSFFLPPPEELYREIREVRQLISEARAASEVGDEMRELLSRWESGKGRRRLLGEMIAVLGGAEEAEEELSELYERLDGLESELMEVRGR